MAPAQQTDPRYKRIAEAAKREGLTGFLLGFRHGPLATFHYENLSIKAIMELMISGFHNVLSMEVEAHPEYSKEYRQIFLDLARDFNALVKSADKKLREYKPKE